MTTIDRKTVMGKYDEVSRLETHGERGARIQRRALLRLYDDDWRVERSKS